MVTRNYEVPEMARRGSPCHLKASDSLLAGHGITTFAAEGRRMAEQASTIVEMVNKYHGELTQSNVRALLSIAAP